MLNVVIFGPPGAGKGTQAALVAKKYQLTHLSSGDLLRQERDNSDNGARIRKYQDSGQLVPDSLVIEIVKKAVVKKAQKSGLVFDGYPRNIRQARSLNSLFKEIDSEIDLVVNLKLSAAKAAQRILLRGQTSGRSDDNRQTIYSRFKVYRAQTAPLLEYYQKQNRVMNIDGSLDIPSVFKKIQEAISKFQKQSSGK